ncbi:MAG: trigger factor [Parcubacteria group bacterium CG10_big_fil_rev_8_21_14_0_10_36_14]|nr:MAG: trigger factor [Parcubacteria group bacterium CG10_big_fil_rev_8_21_14_0_10_36_14]
MKCNVKNLEKSQVELTVELSWDEVKPYLERAAEELSQKSKIEGFRPGKAPYDIVRARFGEHAILEAAAEKIIMKNFVAAIKEKNLETVGQPHIDIEKMAVSNPFIFKATVSLLPKITLGEYKNLGIKKEETKVTDEKVKEALDGLTKMQSKEILKDGPAENKDKVLVDMDMIKDNVPIEGGQAKDMAVYLSEAHYIPGFNEELVGLKKDDEKEFDLNFPKEHYQKHLSGAKVHFKVRVRDVYKIEPPKLDEEFAKSLGQKSIENLMILLRKNLEHEELHKTEEKWEITILNKIVENSKFSDIPELLINGEANQMVYELKNNITRQGLSFEDYLKSINKTEAELKLEFSPEAIKRIKISLVIREIAKAEGVEASDKEVIEEVGKLMNAYKDNADAQKQINSKEYEDYLKSRIENKKTIDILKKNNL